METGIFGAPVIEDLSQSAHDYYHGFLILNGKLMNQAEFSRALPTLVDGTTMTFVAIHDTKRILSKVEWAIGLTGAEIQAKLDADPSLVAFTIDLKYNNKSSTTTEKILTFITTLVGDHSINSNSEASDRITLQLDTELDSFALNITHDA